MTQSSSDDAEYQDMEYPYRDKEVLQTLYIENKLSINQISEKLDCGATTVRDWLKEHDIPIRSIREAQHIRYETEYEAPYYVRENGRVGWNAAGEDGTRWVVVHRLLAVAEYGFDAVRENVVHHKNEIPWDNRPSNITLMSHADHSSHHHTKVRGLDRLRIAELYENGDISSRDLADHVDHDITMTTVLDIHKEFFGGDEADA